MDLLFSIVVVVILVVVIAIVVWILKKAEPNFRNTAKSEAFTEFRSVFSLDITREECVEKLDDIKSRESDFQEEDYDWLVRDGERRLREIDSIEEERIETEPRLKNYRVFIETAAKVKLFNELHRIKLGTSKIISYTDIECFGAKGELEWFKRTYDELLVPRLRQLIMSARHGSVAHYQRVMVLRKELDGFQSSEREDIEDFIAKHLAYEWNEMIVRFKRNPDWYDDIFGYEDLTSEDYTRIITKARGEHDLLNLLVLIKLVEDGNYNFVDALVATVVEELKIQRDAQQLELGFKPGEDERSIAATN